MKPIWQTNTDQTSVVTSLEGDLFHTSVYIQNEFAMSLMAKNKTNARYNHAVYARVFCLSKRLGAVDGETRIPRLQPWGVSNAHYTQDGGKGSNSNGEVVL